MFLVVCVTTQTTDNLSKKGNKVVLGLRAGFYKGSRAFPGPTQLRIHKRFRCSTCIQRIPPCMKLKHQNLGRSRKRPIYKILLFVQNNCIQSEMFLTQSQVYRMLK